MKKLKIYLDTSIINFLFADDAPEYKKITRKFFNNYLNEYDIYISELVYTEINRTKNKDKKKQLLKVIEKYNLEVFNPFNNKIENLAKNYIKQKVIPVKKLDDALHIAFATYYEFDILLSWNFKHIANIKKQIAINSINEKQGFIKKLNLLNPLEVLHEK